MIADPLVRIMDHPHAFKLTYGGAQQLLGALLMSLALPLGMLMGETAPAILQAEGVWFHLARASSQSEGWK